jgi:hypothetical protein
MFENLAIEAGKQSPVARFGTMRGDQNDPPEDVEIHNYPKLVYYAPNSTRPLNMRLSELYPYVS